MSDPSLRLPEPLPSWTRAYPILVGIYPVLHLAAANVREWYDIADLALPLAVSVVATVLAWLIGWLITRDPDKLAFLATLGMLAFAGYGPLSTHLAKLSTAPFFDPRVMTLLVMGSMGVCGALLVVRSRRSWKPVTRFLGLMSCLLVIFALIQLRGWRPRSRPDIAWLVPAVPTKGLHKSLPTIYLIVLDKYTGTDALRSYYDYDNTPVERALRERGFIVPRHPRANYTFTRQAISALLNWEYLDSLAAAVGTDATDWSPLFARIEDNRAMAFLKSLGYEVVFFPNYYPPFRSNRNAELQIPDPHVLRSEFHAIWQSTTLLVPIFAAACAWIHCDQDPWLPEPTALLDWKFAQLGPLAATQRPRFVFAHLLTPHEPYLYRADCTHIPTWAVGPDSSAMRAPYLDQITCVNRKVLAAVDEILRNSATQPIILIQSDHGDGHLPRVRMELGETPIAMILARLDVFAAYYVPGAPDTLFYDGMTPVNLLPRTFNFLFGTTFPRLPDRSSWVVDGAPYRPTAVAPDLVHSAGGLTAQDRDSFRVAGPHTPASHSTDRQ